MANRSLIVSGKTFKILCSPQIVFDLKMGQIFEPLDLKMGQKYLMLAEYVFYRLEKAINVRLKDVICGEVD